ncbi:MAG TPA: hypothetical protein VLG12_03320 [Candidatus Saccharimonadales bacterium]|nr:hypothetical protein [Candidatus Saccharimonadales bacterium]
MKVVPDNGYNGVLWANGSPRPFEHDLNQVDSPYDFSSQLTVKDNKPGVDIPEKPTTPCS